MSAATDPPPPQKLSRYRTIRGRNAPESRRYVEPALAVDSNRTTASTTNNELPLRRTTPGHTPLSAYPPTGDARPPASALPSSSRGDTAALASPRSAQPAVPAGRRTSGRYAEHAPTAQTAPAPQASIAAAIVSPRLRQLSSSHRPSRPEDIDLRHEAVVPAPAPASSLPATTPVSPIRTPILVPLPAARARGLTVEANDAFPSYNDDGDAAAERLLAEQKRKDLERLQRELENHQQMATEAPPPPKSPAREKFGFLTRRRGLSSAASSSAPHLPPAEPLPNSPPPPSTSTSRPTTGYGSRAHRGSGPPIPLQSTAAPTVSPPRPAALTDAPSSAPDKATREVLVRCRQFSFPLPISPDTTVADILQACSERVLLKIDPATSALVENYAKLGLERRLRRYERIRDVMNSWNSDSDNALVVVEEGGKETSTDIGRNGHASDLELAGVSRSKSRPPPGFLFMPLYHSQKPGRWHKRCITLIEETGQLVASKKADDPRVLALTGEGASSTGCNTLSTSSSSDLQSLCHLSDYDVYAPTTTQMRKHLKPPKAFCFAVKSQQRTTVFVNTENYVHFFAVEDPQQARAFYDRVFAWRSWYLVRQLPAAGKKKELQQDAKREQQQQSAYPPSSSSLLKMGGLQRSLSRKSTKTGGAADRSSNRFSVAESLFGGVGNFDPSLDMISRFEAQGRPSVDLVPHNGEAGPAVSSGGLLGSNYDERKKAEASRLRESSGSHAIPPSAVLTSRDDDPFVAGPAFLRDSGGDDAHSAAITTSRGHHQSSSGSSKEAAPAAAEPASWFPSASEHSAMQRSKPRPPSPSEIPLGLQYPQLLEQQKQLQKQQQLEQQRQQQQEKHLREAAMHRARSTRQPTQQSRPPSSSAQGPPPGVVLPTPLVDLTPTFQEAPQWSKERRGHGVRAPVGTTHLVDLATGRGGVGGAAQSSSNRYGGSSNSLLADQQPPTLNGFLRRTDAPPAQQYGSSSTTAYNRRSQTMTSSSAANAASFARPGQQAAARPHHHQAPPVSLLSRIPTNNNSPYQEGTGYAGRDRSTTLTRQ